jgi:hypothetical protein
MDFSLVQIAFVFLPGLIWASIDSKYGAGLRPSQTILMVRSFVFGLCTYSIIYLIYGWSGHEFGYSNLGVDGKSIDVAQLIDEIAWSVPVSFFLAICWLWVVRYRLLMKFLQCIGATRRYGDEDVWSFTLNSDDAHVEYVHVRDLENGFIFAGWVNTYSEGEDCRELLLGDVIVYDEYGTEISNPPFLYLSRPKNSIWIEFPYRVEGYSDVK